MKFSQLKWFKSEMLRTTTTKEDGKKPIFQPQLPTIALMSIKLLEKNKPAILQETQHGIHSPLLELESQLKLKLPHIQITNFTE